jgi:hypothetical protein
MNGLQGGVIKGKEEVTRGVHTITHIDVLYGKMTTSDYP